MICAPLSITSKRDIVNIGSELLGLRRTVESAFGTTNPDGMQVLRTILLGCLQMTVSEKLPNENGGASSNISPAFLDAYLDCPARSLSIIDNEIVQTYYRKIKATAHWEELLPYALELLDYSDQDLTGAKRDRRSGIVTRKKHQSGIYYTPADVAKYMVNGCVDGLESKGRQLSSCTYIDFSCGSGIFLLSILDCLVERGELPSFAKYISFVDSGLFGIDISKCAVECAKYSLLQHSLLTWKDLTGIPLLWRSLEKNIVTADATNLQSFYSNHTEYPKSFNCVIGNPPYVAAANPGTSLATGNLFIPFVCNLQQYSGTTSVSSLVLPLSFACNGQAGFRKVRRSISTDQAEWEIENYDRSPDSLFGDDVKARACIVFRSSSNLHKLKTTGLIRWTSQTRRELLSTRKTLVDISDFSIENYLPKLSSQDEFAAYQGIMAEISKPLPVSELQPSVSSCSIVIKGTAYNWICAYDHVPPSFNEDGTPYLSKGLKYISSPGNADAYLLLAILNSRVAFWLWTVMSDGFHVTNNFISLVQRCKIKISTKEPTDLVQLGQEFSRNITNYPSISINSGKHIIKYDHMPLLDIIKKIDDQVIHALNLSPAFARYLETWYKNIVLCGRNATSSARMEG